MNLEKSLIFLFHNEIDNYSWVNKIPVEDILEVMIFYYKPNMDWEYYLNKLEK